MESFKKSHAVKLRSHIDKYLYADDDQNTVRQSRRGSSRRARWFVEFVEGKNDAIRLRSCDGKYLTATDVAFLLGMTGYKVLQTEPDEGYYWKYEWEPIQDGFQVKLRTWCGKYLRANGGTPPWRNSVTHDDPHKSSTQNWILWDVEAVEAWASDSVSVLMSSRSSLSSLSDEVLGSEPVSPMSVISTASSRFSSKQSFSNKFRSGMDLFHKAKAVRLRSHHDKYLLAEDDEESVTQDRKGSSKTARWTVEFLPDSDCVIRLKSCYNKYLTASNQPFLLGMTGRKVVQSLPQRLDSSVEWEPVREGTQVKLKTRYGNFLRANGGLPPWRNSVTHDIPHRTATQDWVLWDVDIVEIQVQSPRPKSPPPQPLPHVDSLELNPSSPTPVSIKSGEFPRQESADPNVSSPPKPDGRTIYYHVTDENGVVIDEAVEGNSFTFKGNGVYELTRRLEEETGLEDIIVCNRNRFNGKLVPLRLQLPPNNASMNVIVVLPSSKVAKDFAKQGLL
ncbi:hypothetical protein I3843_05G130700 [Carya illinoinensis]|nr:hypothetical protein I3843_05G130700 [Carya illinoinensis]